MSQNTYNGYTNYATWRVNLEVFDGVNPYDFFDSIDNVAELADNLKDFAEVMIFCEKQDGLVADYARAFLSEVNWYEIAKLMQEAYKEE